MGWKVGTGYSRASDEKQAAAEALNEARHELGDAPATFAVVMAAPRYRLSALLSSVSKALRLPEVLGCSTAGEITSKGASTDGVSIFLAANADAKTLLCSAPGTHPDAADKLTAGFEKLQHEARSAGQSKSTTLTLLDALHGQGEGLVDALRKNTRPHQPIVGAAAGDNGEFVHTRVGTANGSHIGGSAALHVFGAKAWGIGLGHGFEASQPRMTVTQAEGNVVKELDGSPAFDAYRRHAEARGVRLTEENAAAYMVDHELGICFFDELRFARAPLKLLPRGALHCAASVPVGSTVCILDGDEAAMLRASNSAAMEARKNAGGKVAGALVFSCVCRREILGPTIAQELSAIRKTLGNVPISGFFSYGEIARYAGRLQGWHNATTVVLALPA